MALANSVFPYAFTVSTTVVATRVYAGILELHVTNVALALVRRHALAVIACLAARHASATISVGSANLRRRAGAVATFDAADRLTSERQVNIVVLHHAITLLADTRIGSYALSIPLAGWMANWIAHVRGAR